MTLKPRFRHHVLDADPPGDLHDITLLTDLTGNGLPDIVIGGKEGGLFWYENPGWARHAIHGAHNLEAGGAILDVNGDGRPDIIAGQQWGGNELYWFECPQDPREPWTCHLIEDRFEKYHDQVVHMQVHEAAARANAPVLSGTIPEAYARLSRASLAAPRATAPEASTATAPLGRS